MKRLISDTFRRFFHSKSSIIIYVISLIVVFLMIFVMPWFNLKMIHDSPTETDKSIAEIISSFFMWILPISIIFTFPFYTSSLLIPVYINNIEHNNLIFILTRKYSRQSLFLTKMIVNAIFALIFSVVSCLSLLIFAVFANKEYTISNDVNSLFVDVGIMMIIFIFTIQILITSFAFFFQKKATLYCILIAILFSSIFVGVFFASFFCLRENFMEGGKVSTFCYHIVYVAIPAALLLVVGVISISLGLTKYKRVNLKV